MPTRTARAIPLGRVAIVALLLFVVLFVLFTLRSMGVQLPFVTHPYVVRAWFDDAAGLDAANGPQVSVAGVPEGQVTGVSYEQGRALVTMSLGSDARGKVFRDASIKVRPFNAANFLQVDIQPGHPGAGMLAPGGVIDSTRTSIPVGTDQVFDVMDADTRAYLQILTEQVATGLHGTGGELAQALARLAPITDEARAIGGTLARRAQLISSLVAETNTIFATLGRRRSELARIVPALTRLLAVTGARTREIELATRRLPQVLSDGAVAGGALSGMAPELDQALARVAPTAGGFAVGLRRTRAAIPGVRQVLGAAESLTRGTSAPARAALSLSDHLDSGVGQAITAYQDLLVLLQALARHEQPIARFTDAFSGLFSTQDAYGVVGRIKLLGVQTPTPEDLGLPASAAVRRAGGHSQLEMMLARAFTAMCRRSQPFACLAALVTPGLPGSLIPAVHGLVGQLTSKPGGAP